MLNPIYHKKFAPRAEDRSHGAKNGRKIGKMSSTAAKDAAVIDLKFIYTNSLKSQLFVSQKYPLLLYTIYNRDRIFPQDNP